MNTRSRYILSVMIVMLALVAAVAGTYAFFAAQINGSDASTSVYVVAANEGIVITFTGGEEENLVNIYPREAAWLEKDITITSTSVSSDAMSIYTFNMVVDENTFYPEDLKYTFTKKTLDGVEEGATETSTLTNLATKVDIAHGLVKMSSAATITYTLKVFFVNDEVRYQNREDQSAKFRITYNWGTPINLTVNLDGGTGMPESMQIASNSIMTLPTPIKEGYVFDKWEVVSGNASVNGNEITLGNTTASIKALWNMSVPPAGSFATDSWETIAYYAAHPENDASPYNVGDTREISLDGFANNEIGSNGLYTIRVVNNSNYNCTLESKTACGFVVEFEDIITTHNMNLSNTNVGGWPATAMRTYVNNDIYNALPQEIRNVIIESDVVSGHGANDNNANRTDGNWTSQDNLYLLSTRELYGNCTGGTNDGAGCYDYSSLDTITRQLDYYKNKGVMTSGTQSFARKKLNNSASIWWLRSASSDNGNYRVVSSDGYNYSSLANKIYGVAPAFRIG